MNKERLNGWKRLAETEEFFDLLKTRRERIKEAWAKGQYINNEREGDRALGEIAFIDSLFELTEEDFLNE